jgi:plasmid stabilization system protein ParE
VPAYKVILTPEALADLTAIHGHISADSPDNAARVAERILDLIDSLADMPQRFALVRTRRRLPYELRKVVVWPYKMFYSIEGTVVSVRTIRHGSRRPWP